MPEHNIIIFFYLRKYLNSAFQSKRTEFLIVRVRPIDLCLRVLYTEATVGILSQFILST